jgi:hypothetical protein
MNLEEIRREFLNDIDDISTITGDVSASNAAREPDVVSLSDDSHVNFRTKKVSIKPSDCPGLTEAIIAEEAVPFFDLHAYQLQESFHDYIQGSELSGHFFAKIEAEVHDLTLPNSKERYDIAQRLPGMALDYFHGKLKAFNNHIPDYGTIFNLGNVMGIFEHARSQAATLPTTCTTDTFPEVAAIVNSIGEDVETFQRYVVIAQTDRVLTDLVTQAKVVGIVRTDLQQAEFHKSYILADKLYDHSELVKDRPKLLEATLKMHPEKRVQFGEDLLLGR